jgi:hypothetical protein
MSDEKLEKRIAATKTTYEKPFMGTEGIARYSISVNQEKSDSSVDDLMLKLYRSLANVFATSPKSVASSPEYAFHNLLSMPELHDQKWLTDEGLETLTVKGVSSEHVYMTFELSSSSPQIMPEKTAYATVQVDGENIFPKSSNLSEDPFLRTTNLISSYPEKPKIKRIVVTFMKDTSTQEGKKGIEKVFKDYNLQVQKTDEGSLYDNFLKEQ